MKKTWEITGDSARNAICGAVMSAQLGQFATVGDPTRTLDQNAAQWPYLEGFSQQIQWPINGVMSFLSCDDWKDILTAAFRQELVRVAPGIDGGMVLLGQRTSKFSKEKFSEWMEFLKAIAAQRGVTPVFKRGLQDVQCPNNHYR